MRAFLLGLVLFAGCGSPTLGYVPPAAGHDARTGLGQLGAQLSEAMRQVYRRQVDRPQAPMQLVPSDGSELELRALEAAVTIDGPLAHTELRFTFHNREARVREGRFSIALPADAAVARFAMKIDGAWREARVVSREQGRRVYESYLHQNVDPALLERDLGNQFSARVFPIAASADKEIIVAYEHRVAETQPYVLPLRGLPIVPKLTVAVTKDGAAQTIDRSGEVPDDVALDVIGGPGAIAAGDAFVARIPASVAPEPDSLERTLILVDTSASRAAVMGRQAELVRRVLAAMPAGATVALAAFDHGVAELYRGAPAGAAAAVEGLFEHGALGASDLGAALRRAAASGMSRVVIVGDGAPTLGEHDAGRLAAIVAAAAIERLDAVQVGQSVDRDTLAALVRAGRRPGAILDGRDPARAARQLAIAMPREEAIHVDGAVATWPSTTRGIAPGEPVWVFGLHPGAATGPITVRVGERAFPVASKAAGDARRVRRAVAVAELGELTASLATASADDRTAIGARIERLALEYRLVSARTSLIVLESDLEERRMLDGPAPGRTFEQAIGAASGSQSDPLGVSIAGSTSVENTYVVEGVNSTGYTVRVPERPLAGNALQHRELARAVQGSAFTLAPADGTPEKKKYAAPYTGTLHRVMQAISDGQRATALELASAWQLASPGDLAALIGLGEALEARGASALAARAYTSIIDLYPNRAELVRAAGERLDRLIGGRALSIDAYRRAIRERPDQPSTYRLLAFALVRDGRPAEALDALDEGMRHARRQSVLQLLAEDAAIVAAHAVARDPASRSAVEKRVRGPLPAVPSLRIVLSWETDANDVDLHVHDRRGNHAYYQSPEMVSGGRLREDLTDGFGPELFAVDDPRAFPYQVGAHYYRRGPMGLGLGTVQVIRHDGRGNLAIEDRPFVIQNDDALVDLGVIKGT
ncbi:MAG: hypothetical protein KF773_42705 [Deltaproteobacteria bacterium]|nr:hypothetical protein [Deltaproteobacteria bacterium]